MKNEQPRPPLPMKGGKLLLDFNLREYPEGMAGPNGEPFGVAPPHWRMQDPHGVITCWGHVGNGSFESMVAIMRLAALGAKHASVDELREAGIMFKPRIWTPDDGGDDSMATHIGETGGFYDGKRHSES